MRVKQFDSFTMRAALIASSVVVFLLVFRPFSLSLASPWHWYIYFGLGLIIFTILHVNHYVLSPALQRLPWQNTTQRALFGLIFFSTCTIGAVYAYLSYFSTEDGSSNLLLGVKIILVAILPVAGSYLIRQRQTLRQQVFELKEDLLKIDVNHRILLQSENGKDQLQLQKDDILYIRAEDNYVSIAHLIFGEVKEVLLRSTLSSLEQLLKEEGFLQCHRSYLVNLSNIKRLRPSAGSHVLEIRGDSTNVPVSRRFLPIIRQSLKSDSN